MKSIPRLTPAGIQSFATTIGIDSKFPTFLILNELFNQGSGYSQYKTFSERLAAYMHSQKQINDNERTVIIGLTTEILEHFRNEGLLTYADYDSEYEKCRAIIFPNS